MNGSIEMVREYLHLGGPLMWPLLVCSIILGAVLFERCWVVILRHTLLGLNVPALRLHWHRRVLPFFVDVPPAIGLLGTVVGLVQSFDLNTGRPTGQALGMGLGVACYTTIFGLGIAIIAAISQYGMEWLAGDYEALIKPVDAR
jgi:biopolymer transport protein ExbB/TolQ